MNIDYLIQVLTNRLNMLNQSKDQAYITGDLDRVNAFDTEINSVQDTLYKLRLLNDVNNAAVATGVTTTEAMKNAIDSTQNNDASTSASGSGDTTPLLHYDLSTYAADPLYIDKITHTLSNIGAISSAADVDKYIQAADPGSPVTGDMVWAAAQSYVVDVRLLMAIMQLESGFGTVGVGASTSNPGNIGNTGTSTRPYDSWSAGVMAIADWLSKHRVAIVSNDDTTSSTATSTASTGSNNSNNSSGSNNLATTTAATSTTTSSGGSTATSTDQTGGSTTTTTDSGGSTATSTNQTGSTATSTDQTGSTATSTDSTGGGTATTTPDTGTTATTTSPTDTAQTTTDISTTTPNIDTGTSTSGDGTATSTGN